MEPVRFENGSDFLYEVDASTSTEISFNEAFYRGWSLEACEAGGTCTDVPVRIGSAGQVVADIPEGEWELALRYRLPGVTEGWIAFAVSVLGVLVWTGVNLVRGRRTRRGNDYGAAVSPRA